MDHVNSMKTLILNGSPRENGDTAGLIREVIRKLPGEYKVVNAYRCNIFPALTAGIAGCITAVL